MTIFIRVLLLLALYAGAAGISRAVEPDEILPDAVQEQRARTITSELRCVVCQNQSVDDSDAPLAKDIRTIVRERISNGDTDRQVIDFIVQRYGKFVLLRPPLEFDTALIWIGPFALLGIALVIAWSVFKQGAPTAPPPLSSEEESRVKNRLAGDA